MHRLLFATVTIWCCSTPFVGVARASTNAVGQFDRTITKAAGLSIYAQI